MTRKEEPGNTAPLKLHGRVSSTSASLARHKKVEDFLRESEKRYRLLLNAMNEGVAVVDTKLRLVYVNDRFCRMVGYRRGELVGQSADVFLDRPNQEITRHQMKLRARGVTDPYELVFTHKNGRRVYGLVSPRPIVSAKGRFDGSITVVTDISQLKQTEAALREARTGLDRRVRERTEELKASERAERRLRELLTKLHDVVLALSSTGSFDDLCRRAIEWGRKRLGFDRLGLWFSLPTGEIQGSFGTDEQGRLRDERGVRIRVPPTTELARVLTNETHLAVREDAPLPDDHARSMGRGTHVIAALWDGGQVIGFLGADNLIHRKPIDTAQQQVLALYATALGPLCSRARATEALRASEERYRTLVESTKEAISTVDRKGVFLFMNSTAASRLGGKPADFIGKTVWELFPKAIADRNAASIRRVIRTQRGLDVDSLTELQGRRRWYRTTVEPMRDGSGKVYAALVVARDQTERKEAVDALRASEERYRQLFATETDAIVLADVRTRRFMDINESACRLYGYTREEFLRLDMFDITADPALSGASVKETIRRKKFLVPLRYHKKKDGTVFPVEISASTFDFHGTKVFCAAIRDITARIRAEKALRSIRAKLISSREEERRRLSRELHDSVGQKLIASRLKLQAAAQIPSVAGHPELPRTMADLSGQLGELTEEVRQVSRALYPPTLEALGLPAALRQLAHDMESAQAEVKVCCDSGAEIRRPQEVSIAIYRITQEAVSNAIRHGKPRHVDVTLDCSDGQLHLTILDDGKGFNPEKATGKGLGLLSMRERADAIGATFRLTSKPGRTCVDVRMRNPKTQ